MSIFLSYLVVPIVLLLLGLNIFFRIKIIRKYQRLKNEELDFNVDKIFNKAEREALIKRLPTDQAQKVEDFSKNLRQLVMMAIGGFVLIVLIFLLTYFNQ